MWERSSSLLLTGPSGTRMLLGVVAPTYDPSCWTSGELRFQARLGKKLARHYVNLSTHLWSQLFRRPNGWKSQARPNQHTRPYLKNNFKAKRGWEWGSNGRVPSLNSNPTAIKRKKTLNVVSGWWGLQNQNKWTSLLSLLLWNTGQLLQLPTACSLTLPQGQGLSEPSFPTSVSPGYFPGCHAAGSCVPDILNLSVAGMSPTDLLWLLLPHHAPSPSILLLSHCKSDR
jgi:hypothetical protein